MVSCCAVRWYLCDISNFSKCQGSLLLGHGLGCRYELGFEEGRGVLDFDQGGLIEVTLPELVNLRCQSL